MPRLPLSKLVLVIAPLVLGTGCSTTTDSSTSPLATPESGAMVWLEASPELANRMDQRMEQVPWVHGLEEHVEMSQWWADKGEPAYSRLLKMAGDPRPNVADLALAALASSRDGRLVGPLREIPWPSTDQVDLRYSRARTHLRLGDWSHVGELVNGLEDDRLRSRSMCIKILRDTTRMDFGYHAQAPEEQRAVAVQRWREWVASRQGDPLLVPVPTAK